MPGRLADALCGAALTAVLLIVGMTTSPIGPEADTTFCSGIVQAASAAPYIITALTLIDPLIRRRKVSVKSSLLPDRARNRTFGPKQKVVA